jgi:hypothetical protein
MLLNNMLPQGNIVPKRIYEAKQIICQLGLELKKIHVCTNDCILYHGAEYEDLEKCPIVDSTDSIMEKMAVMMGTATEEKTCLKRCFGTFLSFLV